jgi:hypothetical protein
MEDLVQPTVREAEGCAVTHSTRQHSQASVQQVDDSLGRSASSARAARCSVNGGDRPSACIRHRARVRFCARHQPGGRPSRDGQRLGLTDRVPGARLTRTNQSSLPVGGADVVETPGADQPRRPPSVSRFADGSVALSAQCRSW